TPEGVAAILRQHPVTAFYAVPTFYAAFLANAAAPRRTDLNLRCCVSAGEALPPDVGRRWKERYGLDVLDGIGSTEMLHIFLSNYPANVKYGTTGKPVPGYDIRLTDDDGNVITRKGEMGELQVRGPTSAIMYWNDRERSRETFLGEWTRSGDKYLQDEDGYYVYCGRRDDMLKVGGIYVSPFEVEGALCTHPEVLEAAVVAWADVDELIKPKAFVVLKSPEKTCEELARALQEHVKPAAAPQRDHHRAFAAAIGRLLRLSRAKRGMTRRQLAHASGASERYLAQIESGQGNPSVIILESIARALDIPIIELLPRSNGRTPAMAEILDILARVPVAELPSLAELIERRASQHMKVDRGRRIALIGLRGAGKSTLGRRLADALGCPFIELDRLIEQD